MSNTKLIKTFFQQFNILTNQEIEDFIQNSTSKIIKKDDFFIRQGEACREAAFLVSGIFRSFYISDKGEEITYCITFPNNLITAYSSFITGNSTSENIQAICDVELLVVPKYVIDDFSVKNPNWVKFLKVIAEQQYIELEKRIFQLQKSNALERYSDLIKNQPEYLQKIPLQYLASYLSITQRHLSRIRKEISF